MRNVIQLENYFEEVGVIEEQWTDIDGRQYVDKFKQVKLSEGLTLVLADDGSATLAVENVEHTIKWDDEVADMFSRFDELKASELFELIYRKRWGVSA